MSLRRFLGAGWASVHGPADERKLALWTLDLGFGGLLVSPSPRPIDWRALRRGLDDLPFELPALRVPEQRNGSLGLASGRDGERQEAVAIVRGAAEEAAALGISAVIIDVGCVPVAGEVAADDLVEPRSARGEAAAALFARRRPGLDRALDRVCRSLFALGRALPDTTLLLAPSPRITGVADPEGLAAIFEDLGSVRLGYWHRPSIAAKRKMALGEDQGAWLERFADRMAGLTLGDASEDGIDLPPGAGLVDYAMVASYTRRGTPLPGVVELDPAVDPGEIAGVRSFLSKFGL